MKVMFFARYVAFKDGNKGEVSSLVKTFFPFADLVFSNEKECFIQTGFEDYSENSGIVSVILRLETGRHKSVEGKAEKSTLRHWSASVSYPNMALT